MQGVNANMMPINEERVAVERRGLTFNDGRLLRLAGLSCRQDRDRCGNQDRAAR